MKYDDEKLYQQVADETTKDGPIKGLWLKALTETLGDEQKAKYLYIKLRVDQLRSEIEITKRKQFLSSDLFKNTIIIIIFVVLFVWIIKIFDKASNRIDPRANDRPGYIVFPPKNPVR